MKKDDLSGRFMSTKPWILAGKKSILIWALKNPDPLSFTVEVSMVHGENPGDMPTFGISCN